MSLLESIKQHGYWELVVRPTAFQEHRVERLTELQKVLRAAQVRIRGWPFPCVDEQAMTLGADFVGLEDKWEEHLEAWRFYQSGMFVAFRANRWDLMAASKKSGAKPGSVLSVGDSIFQICEFFEFASRLGVVQPWGPTVRIDVRCHRLIGRHLYVDVWHQTPGGKTHAESWAFGRDYPAAHLAAEARALALEAASDLFQRFGWDASSQVLQGILDRYAT